MDASEGKFFDHKSRDNLRLVRNLESSLMSKQFLLSNEKREKLDLLVIESIVHVPRPLIFVLIQSLCFIAEEHHGAASCQRRLKPDPHFEVSPK